MDAQALCQERQDAGAAHRACLAPAAADEWAAPAVGRLDVPAKCRAAVRDSLLAKDLDFLKAVGACLAAAVYWGAPARRDARKQFPVRQLQVALQKAVYSAALPKVACLKVPQLLAEPRRLRVVKQGQPVEWVSVLQPEQAERASQRPERPSVLAAWQQFLERQAQQPEPSPDEPLEPPVWPPAKQVLPERLASQHLASRDPAARQPPPVPVASTVPLSLQLPSLASPLWRPLPPQPRLPQLPEFFSEPSLQHPRESNLNASSSP